MKAMFFVDWGPFNSQTLVVVGHSNAEIVKFLRRRANTSDISLVIAAFERGGRPKPEETTAAFTFYHSGKTILYFSTWTGDDEDLDTLVHETNHLIYDVFGGKGMRREPEACAYMQAHLFRKIKTSLDVKSKQQEVRNAGQDSSAQRTTRAMPRVPSRFDEEAGIPDTDKKSRSINGRCCS